MGTSHKIHVGFNFHVDFLHSNKGDTNDENGFGRDLTAVRFILETLEKANNEGQPVKATWDIEGDYTLGRILPSLGPDVIDGIKTRIRERADELLLSGNSSDIFAAMTGKEIRAALRKATTGNVHVVSPGGEESVKSVFARTLGEPSTVLSTGSYVFSPSIIGELKKAGVSAVVLGNSNVGPDALTTVAGELRKSSYIAYNPVTYRHGEESITLIPSYSAADLLDAGSLTKTFETIHEEQLQNIIDGDVFILISGDVKNIFWEDMGISSFFRPMHETEGLSGFLKELRKLDYVAYNTPSGYIRDHAAVAECSFAGDVAAGIGSDLSAFGEMPYDRLIWTRLDRARSASLVYSKERSSDSLEKRVELLSSHNFGEAIPAPAKDRFTKAEGLSAQIQEIERKAINEKEMSMRTSGRQRLNNSAIGKHHYSRRKDDEERNSFIIMNPQGQRTVTYQLAIEKGQCPKISTLVLECDECQMDSYVAIEMESSEGFVTTAFVAARFSEAQSTYKIYYHFNRTDLPKAVHKPLIEVKPEEIPVFHAEGAMKRLLEAQGKLEKPKEPEVNNTNPAVAERIAAINSATNTSKPGTAAQKTEKDSYIIESLSRKLRVVINGTGANKGKIREVYYGDERIGDDQFMSSFIKANGKFADFSCEKIEDIEVAGLGEGVALSGTVHAAGERAPGKYKFYFVNTPVLRGVDGILVYADVTYPDAVMQEVAPLQITPLYRAGVSVIKRTFTGDVSEFPVSCFGKAVRDNSSITSFNQQLTAGIVGVRGALSGLLVGYVRNMLGSMAVCPGRLLTDGEGQHLSLNLFGTYGINKRKYPSESEGLLQEVSDFANSSYRTDLGSAYSSVRERFCFCLTAFPGASMHEVQMSELAGFCDGAIICGDEAGVIHPFEGDNVAIPSAQKELPAIPDKEPDMAKVKIFKNEVAKYINKKRKEQAGGHHEHTH
ncbi:MAG: hypothetical protein E7302_11390 [Butyrivibrio sp.]|nr:hypothetical protein [Butyrivibrio sp.]